MLTAKQAAFVQEYMVDRNATQAAIRAGYSENTAKVIGHENLTKPDIASAIDSAEKAAAEKAGISTQWVLERLKTVADRCMQAAPVLGRGGEQIYVETPDGNIVPAFTFQAMAANKSLELLGKHVGLFQDRKPGDSPDNPQYIRPLAAVPAKEGGEYAWQNDTTGNA